MKRRTETWMALAAGFLVLAWIGAAVWGASEDANPSKHVRSLLVDTSGEAVTPAKTAQLPTALAAGGGLKVEGVAGGVAQPVSGTVTANAGTNLNTSALALEAGGNLAAIAADLNELTAAPVAKTPTFLSAVIIGTPGTPTALANNDTFFTYAVLQAGRAAAANASLITIGGNTAYTTQRATELAPGDTWSLIPPAGTKWDLNDFYIDGVNTDDGVRIMYIAP